ncbi:hypothetical protein HELRODRAFT_171235 [Helobdella robusta]|uniref:Uncharacterized protein n=1 Tax=Helobdella robusta TaxID=6412 RepID=T1F3Z2_HELRO|nr:hypothetical protein HELRODRAFT_171235 [Helobdella robusta]ESO05587.1 hypothetical protein HELRODRAFT_171235 [Helobdella robusta]
MEAQYLQLITQPSQLPFVLSTMVGPGVLRKIGAERAWHFCYKLSLILGIFLHNMKHKSTCLPTIYESFPPDFPNNLNPCDHVAHSAGFPSQIIDKKQSDELISKLLLLGEPNRKNNILQY